ncbi:hypothetical protein HMPREF1008_01244 [Olsenella sp. oral taxon 809 str. F0356]|uniref:hypothetical protein n=1 Tax=Olsenella sp. oral taxon 809 TaxID=661086 RepID=UPI000231F190|nr:hypothetical protein [Olsenella sp. oral taxon 809]EHF01620.1 hypothetical protein HMPREF1008_01244 [Olsenella sp. oral taxon 809 str. F0356]
MLQFTYGVALMTGSTDSVRPLAVLIACACPVGSNVAVYAQLHGKDYRYAAQTVVVSALLSIVTIPALVWLAETIW